MKLSWRHYYNQAQQRIKVLHSRPRTETTDPLRAEIELAQLQATMAMVTLMADNKCEIANLMADHRNLRDDLSLILQRMTALECENSELRREVKALREPQPAAAWWQDGGKDEPQSHAGRRRS